MSLGGLAGVRFLVDQHHVHEPPDALLVHRMPFVPKVPGHLPDNEERRFGELLDYQEHGAKRSLVHLSVSTACPRTNQRALM